MAGFAPLDGDDTTPGGGTAVIDRPDTDIDTTPATDKGWNTVVANDPVNEMGYVTEVFMLVLDVDEAGATKLMMQIHQNGRGIVFHGTKDEANEKMLALQGYQLWASVERV